MVLFSDLFKHESSFSPGSVLTKHMEIVVVVMGHTNELVYFGPGIAWDKVFNTAEYVAFR